MTQSQQHPLSEREHALIQAVRRSIQIVEQISLPLALEIISELEAALAPLPGEPIDLSVCGGVIIPIVEPICIFSETQCIHRGGA
jgi:hypothetical protein